MCTKAANITQYYLDIRMFDAFFNMRYKGSDYMFNSSTWSLKNDNPEEC